MPINVKPAVRTRLALCNALLTPESGVSESHPAREITIAHEATFLALTALCDQLECLPHKTRACLTDYLEVLKKLRPPRVDERGAEFFLDLHKARVDMQNRAILPDPVKWQGTRRTALENITKLCDVLNIPLSTVQPESTSRSASLSTARTGPAASATMVRPGAENLPAANMTAEVRRYPRYDCTGAVELSSPHTGRPLKGKLLNLSIGGCFAQADWPLEVGTRVEVRLELSGLSFRALGEVRMVDSRGGMGIEFGGMSAGGRQRLGELIAELEEGSAVDAERQE